MNTIVKDLRIESKNTRYVQTGIFIQEITRNLNEALRYAEMHEDPEILYFTSMALQCVNEKILLSMYDSL
jgi:hypothetical protein